MELVKLGPAGRAGGTAYNTNVDVEAAYQGWVENLLNADGDTFAYGNPFSLRIAPQATPQRPLTAGFALSRRF